MLFTNVPVISYSQFLGGNGDGHADLNFINTVCSAISVNPFAGGDADGHADLNLINTACSSISVNPFAGGDADGHADLNLINTVCSSISVNPFAGGDADGHADLNLINTACSAISVNPFAGGDADGHADLNLINTACSAISVNPFAGGDADGHADLNLINTVCSAISVNPFAGGDADGHADMQRLVIDPSDCTTPLPIELLYFNAKCNNNKVNITWTTASEINNDYFTLERSIDVIKWEIIGHIDGVGSSNQTMNYSFIDTEPLPNISYYRLKQTDFDGRYQYFDLAAVNCKDNDFQSIKIIPNPNTGNFIIQGFESDSDLIIYNSLGEIIFSTKIVSSDKQIEIDLNNQNCGMYYVIVKSKNKGNSKKMIISR